MESEQEEYFQPIMLPISFVISDRAMVLMCEGGCVSQGTAGAELLWGVYWYVVQQRAGMMLNPCNARDVAPLSATTTTVPRKGHCTGPS